MKNHLSDDQIIRHLAGENRTKDIQHLAECAVCTAELERIREALSNFRGSVRSWTDLHAEFIFTPPQPSRLRRALSWSMASAALLAMAAAIPLYRNAERQRETRTEEDNLLLEQVNAQLSRPFPESVEQLVNLLPDDNSTDNGETR